MEKTSTRRRSRIPCVVVEQNYDAPTWRRRRRRRKKWRKSTNFQQKFVWCTYSTQKFCVRYTKQINNLKRKKNYESKTVDVSMM